MSLCPTAPTWDPFDEDTTIPERHFTAQLPTSIHDEGCRAPRRVPGTRRAAQGTGGHAVLRELPRSAHTRALPLPPPPFPGGREVTATDIIRVPARSSWRRLARLLPFIG